MARPSTLWRRVDDGGSLGGRVGGPLRGSFYNSTDVALNATTIVAAASNVNGVVVRGASMTSAAGNNLYLFSGAVPTSQTSNQVLLWSNNGALNDLKRDIFLPPGSGLHLWGSAAAQVANCGYDIL